MVGIQVWEPGGPDAMRFGEIETPSPGPGEALVRVEATGVNFIDVYHRSGLYPLGTPFIPGTEAAGTVERLGGGVEDPRIGERVAFIHVGTYAEYAVVPAAKLVAVPEWMDARTAAAALLQGVTAQYLTTSTYPVQPGDRVLVHAAAGGVGALLVQLAKRRGATVFGTASTTKLDVVREAGADHVIDYTAGGFDEAILALTDGAGLDVVYDSVGKTTFDGSLRCLRPRGMLVVFGQSSGPVAPFDLLRLSKGSTYITRPTLVHYTATRAELLARTADLFEHIREGRLRLRVARELPLREAAQAHRLLESRATTGKLLLVP